MLMLRHGGTLQRISLISHCKHQHPNFVQTRGSKDVFGTFVKNWKKNLEQEPELGGSIKKLTDSTKEAAKSTQEGSAEKVKKAGAVIDEYRQKKSENIKEVEEKYFTGFNVNLLSIPVRLLRKFQYFTERMILPKEKFEKKEKPDPAEVQKILTQEMEQASRRPPKKRNPPPAPPKPWESNKADYSAQTSLVPQDEHTHSLCDELCGRYWETFASSETIFAPYIEKADTATEEKVEKSTHTKMMELITLIHEKHDPIFHINIFKRYISRFLVPRVLFGRIQDHEFRVLQASRNIHAHYMTKQLPLIWDRYRVKGVDVFPGSDKDSGVVQFHVSIRCKAVLYINGRPIPHRITLIVTAKINSFDAWEITEYHVADKRQILF